MGGKRITTIPICYRLFLLMFLIVNVQVCKMDLKCAFGINLGISGELKMRECVLPSGSGCVGTCAAQGVAQYLTGCTTEGLDCWWWTGVIGVKFQTVVLWALYQAASRLFWWSRERQRQRTAFQGPRSQFIVRELRWRRWWRGGTRTVKQIFCA